MEIEEEERSKIRENISNLSFEELLKLKEEIGSKTFNDTLFNSSSTGNKRKKLQIKRVNKNRPREVSSKIKVPTKLRSEVNVVPVVAKTSVPRDPRFDPLCGQFDRDLFKTNYSFVNDIRLNEKRELEEKLENCDDPAERKTIKLLLQRVKNQIRESERTEKEEFVKKQESNEIREKLKKGEKPEYKKKSVKKLENLIEKYEDLKKSNKIHKHIEKKSKKIAQKEKRENKMDEF
ncbi:unnamed protein product [Phyllotreta striolata]|uniref:rRNA biogenesis protein RRP36 n=1 Tax=Phyllotreta striolata TaxID=444603 RepID=A0A9N9TE92_PHYSR|nr:unnamed protein product [Phyllotreta striolata]